MKPARLRELLAAPELALLPPLLAALDAIVTMLRTQHVTLDQEWTASDPTTLREARALVAALEQARDHVVAYRRAVHRSLREPCCDSDDLPF